MLYRLGKPILFVVRCRAPECDGLRAFDEKSDIWSLGCVVSCRLSVAALYERDTDEELQVYQLVCGRPLFKIDAAEHPRLLARLDSGLEKCECHPAF